jgi:hypothetical protein
MLNGLLLLVALLLPIWKQRSKVWTDRTDLRKIGLKAGHFRPQFEHFEYYAFVNLQPSSVVSRFQSQLSKRQWLCCSDVCNHSAWTSKGVSISKALRRAFTGSYAMETSHIPLELYVSLPSQEKHDDVHSSPRRMISPVTLRAKCSLLARKPVLTHSR